MQVGWLFGKNCFLMSNKGVKAWLNKMLWTAAQDLDYQLRWQRIRFQKFGINYITYACVVRASQAMAMLIYNAITKVLLISESSMVGFIGYNALNVFTKEDYESVA